MSSDMKLSGMRMISKQEFSLAFYKDNIQSAHSAACKDTQFPNFAMDGKKGFYLT